MELLMKAVDYCLCRNSDMSSYLDTSSMKTSTQLYSTVLIFKSTPFLLIEALFINNFPCIQVNMHITYFIIHVINKFNIRCDVIQKFMTSCSLRRKKRVDMSKYVI